MEKVMGVKSKNKRPGTCALVLFAAALAFLTAPAAKSQVNLSGHASTEYRYRATEDETDQDVYVYLGLDAGDPYTDMVTGHLFARGAADVDGKTDVEDEFYVFDSADDTYDSSVTGRLYFAYLDFHKVTGIKKIRLGRQTIYWTPRVLYFDGALVETKEAEKYGNIMMGVYGGLPVNLFESDYDLRDQDALYGAYCQARPLPGGRIRVNWTHLDDETLYAVEDDAENDDYYSVDLTQSFNQYLRVDANYTMLEEVGRDARGSITFYQPEWDFMLQASYYRLLEEQEQESITFDPFFAALFELHPYWQASVLAGKGLGDNFGIEGGYDIRMLSDEDDRGNFNHEFEHYFGTVYAVDLIDGLELSATGEVWDSIDQMEIIRTYGGDVTYRLMDGKLLTSAGTCFQLYEYDYYLDEEKDEVRTYYARVAYKQRQGFGFDLRYEFEDSESDNGADAGEEFHVLRARLKYAF